MAWDFRITPDAQKNLEDIGPSAADEVVAFLEKRVRGCLNPRAFGKPLLGDLKGYWRYRVRDWRVLCRFEDKVLIVVVVALGHRSTIYEN